MNFLVSYVSLCACVCDFSNLCIQRETNEIQAKQVKWSTDRTIGSKLNTNPTISEHRFQIGITDSCAEHTHKNDAQCIKSWIFIHIQTPNYSKRR